MSVAELKVHTKKVINVFTMEIQKRILIDVLLKNQAFIIQLQKDQLKSGKKADGSDMPKYVKGSKQPDAPGKWTFDDTGQFYSGIDAIFGSNEFIMSSNDSKTDLLIWMAGKQIFGLTGNSLVELKTKIKPQMIEANRVLIRRI